MDYIFSKVTGFQVDSRKIKPGEAFFALPGQKVDGTRFLEQAANNKGIIAFIPADYRGKCFGLRVIRVECVLGALQELARRSLENEKIIGITGSLGKTSTKELLFQLLDGDIDVYKNPRSYNGQIGLPLSILNRDRSKKTLICEYGIDQVGGMDKLLEIARPDIGLLTKISEVHLEGLKNLEGVKREKCKLLHASKKTICEKGVFQADRTFGKDGDVWIEKRGNKVILNDLGENEINPPFLEEHMLFNLQAAYLVARECGVSKERLIEKIQSLKLPEMRFQKVKKGDITIIKDMYNASVESNKAALTSMPSGGRKIGVLGDMVDMGNKADELHHKVGEIASECVDILLLVGEKSKEMKKGFEKNNKKPCFHFSDKDKLCVYLKNLLQKDDIVLIKGSRFMQMETIYKNVFED